VSVRKSKRVSRPTQRVDGSRRLLRLDVVMEMTGLSRSSIYRAMDLGTFPRAVNISPRAVGWNELAVTRWIEERLGAAA
jgi:prophage regulatory protein